MALLLLQERRAMSAGEQERPHTQPEGERPAVWIQEPEAPEFELEHQSVRQDDSQPTEEPGYGHGV